MMVNVDKVNNGFIVFTGSHHSAMMYRPSETHVVEGFDYTELAKLLKKLMEKKENV